MRFFTKSLLVMLAVSTFTFMSCGDKDEDCTAPALATNIVGTWTADGGTGTVEFQSNGTLVDPNDDIIGGEINGDVLSVKTYSATNDSLYVSAASPTTTNMIDATFPVTGNECDKITLEAFGIPFNLNRN